jgi:hypothetical protein
MARSWQVALGVLNRRIGIRCPAQPTLNESSAGCPPEQSYLGWFSPTGAS